MNPEKGSDMNLRSNRLIWISLLLVVSLPLSLTGCSPSGTPAASTATSSAGISLTTEESLEGEGILIGAEGGNFDFEDQITLSVPAGALEGQARIQIEKVDPDQVNPILQQPSINTMHLLAAFDIEMVGQELRQPVTLRLPTYPIQIPGGIPVLLNVDLEEGTYEYATADILYDPDNAYVEVTLDHFSTGVVTSVENAEIAEECSVPETACRCKTIRVESKALDFTSGKCQIVSDSVDVQFLDCPGQPVESSRLEEKSPSCDWYGTLEVYAFAGFPPNTSAEYSFEMDIFFTLEADGLSGGGRGSTEVTVDETDLPPECSLILDEPIYSVEVSGTWTPETFSLRILPDENDTVGDIGLVCQPESFSFVFEDYAEMFLGYLRPPGEPIDVPNQPRVEAEGIWWEDTECVVGCGVVGYRLQISHQD